MICHCGQELFIAPILLDDQPVLMHASGRLFYNGRCFEKELSEDDVLTLALFCVFEGLHPEDVRLQAGRFFEGREFINEDVQRILLRMVRRDMSMHSSTNK
jgi:hypothetical protein